MNLIRWSYTKRYNIKAKFDTFPNSAVLFRQIKNYYFVYSVKWSTMDSVVTKKDLEKMELLLNRELGTEDGYRHRSQFKAKEPPHHI
ncbi:hypothetical protein [Bacillus sp. REN3]|uniref:hypothetical protein n=1 Tax=Bacillus sp. REN3 TaxID=2802440 RepID=UPI001AED9C95|nr:hypothetical protein [Bacillus sp. REN3]